MQIPDLTNPDTSFLCQANWYLTDIPRMCQRSIKQDKLIIDSDGNQLTIYELVNQQFGRCVEGLAHWRQLPLVEQDGTIHWTRTLDMLHIPTTYGWRLDVRDAVSTLDDTLMDVIVKGKRKRRTDRSATSNGYINPPQVSRNYVSEPRPVRQRKKVVKYC
jgi:hypothetical protein